jgi:hypothetical protein
MATGILNHMMTAGQALKGMDATPMAGSTSGSGGTSGTNGTTGTSGSDSSDDSSSDSTISANDFLTLLVTEMQNQDPTADTDPNEYINQLVQVNSLEQLIDINQTLSGDSAAPASSGAGSGTGCRSNNRRDGNKSADGTRGGWHGTRSRCAARGCIRSSGSQRTNNRRQAYHGQRGCAGREPGGTARGTCTVWPNTRTACQRQPNCIAVTQVHPLGAMARITDVKT